MGLPRTKNTYFSELQKLATLHTVPTIELACILLVFHDVPEASVACDAIEKKLCRSSWKWVKREELFSSALTILAVHSYNPSKINGVCLAYLANKMLENEVEVGGPYYDNDHTIDVRTNVAISQLFHELGSPLSNVDAYVSTQKPRVTDDVVCKFLMTWSKPLFSQTEKMKIASIMPYVAKALDYKKRDKTNENTLQKQILKLAYDEIQGMEGTLKSCMTEILGAVHNADTHDEIKMLPAYFANSLRINSGTLSRQLMVKLGVANFFTWAAYTIYDDFFDDEGQTKLLPAANVCLRKAFRIYGDMSQNNLGILAYFDKMDAANSWEISHCRFDIEKKKILIKQLPHYGDFMVLADRAYGHIIGPLVVLDQLSVSRLKRTFIENGLNHFLIAKQLSDDLRDWKEDLKNGHISAVISWVLAKNNIASGWHNVSELTKNIQKKLWERDLGQLNELILDHVSAAEDFFVKSKMFDFGGDFFTHVIFPLKKAVILANEEYSHEKEFLDTYSGHSRLVD